MAHAANFVATGTVGGSQVSNTDLGGERCHSSLADPAELLMFTTWWFTDWQRPQVVAAEGS